MAVYYAHQEGVAKFIAACEQMNKGFILLTRQMGEHTLHPYLVRRRLKLVTWYKRQLQVSHPTNTRVLVSRNKREGTYSRRRWRAKVAKATRHVTDPIAAAMGRQNG